jgi:hypothetical protein
MGHAGFFYALGFWFVRVSFPFTKSKGGEAGQVNGRHKSEQKYFNSYSKKCHRKGQKAKGRKGGKYRYIDIDFSYHSISFILFRLCSDIVPTTKINQLFVFIGTFYSCSDCSDSFQNLRP